MIITMAKWVKRRRQKREKREQKSMITMVSTYHLNQLCTIMQFEVSSMPIQYALCIRHYVQCIMHFESYKILHTLNIF